MGKIIALADWRVKQIAIAALLCTVLGELFDPFPFDVPEGVPRVILVVAAYFGTGLFTYELTKNRRLTCVTSEIWKERSNYAARPNTR